MAKKFVDRAYDHNEKAMSFYQNMIIVHVILTLVFLIISIALDRAFAWVEAYTLPVLGYFINAHRRVTLDNPNILDKSNASIEKATTQDMIKQNLRLQRLMKGKEGTK